MENNNNGLETIVQSYRGNSAYAVAASYSNDSPVLQYTIPLLNPLPTFSYQGLSHSSPYKNNPLLDILFQPHQEYHFEPDHFLKPGKEGIFVGKATAIREHIEEAFEKMFNVSFPADIKLSICNEKEFRMIAPSPGVIGISFNRKKQGLLSEIFVIHDYLARVMLTIGHELGHVLTETLANAPDEEAKAYAFSFAWMEMIKKHNIAGLRDAIVLENPAQNGLHNVAFGFINKELRRGKSAWEVYKEMGDKGMGLFLE